MIDETKLKPSNSHKSYALPLIVLVFTVAMVLYVAGPFEYQLRFEQPALNYWAAAGLATALPISITWLFMKIPSPKLCFIGIIVAGVIAIPAVIFAFFAIASAPKSSSIDNSFELIGETSNHGVVYRLYRTNCGATCAYSLEVQREISTPIGLKLVTPLWSKYRESEAEIKSTANSVQVIQHSVVIWEGKY